MVVTVSVTTKYNTTEGVCSTVIHVPAPIDKVITVTQNVTSTQWWLERKTKTRTDTVTVNATSTDACYIPEKSPIGTPLRGSVTIATDLPESSSEPELVFEDEDGEDHAFHPEI